MRFKMNKKIALVLALLALLLSLPVAAVRASPNWDGGGFPTLTPTGTPISIPTATWTPTPQALGVTLQPAYPAPTQTAIGLEPLSPSNIQEAGGGPEAPSGQQGETGAVRSSPLITAAYIGLFIFLVVGVWMLFGRRGMGGP